MKIIPQIDTYPRLVNFCETPLGKVVALAAFAAALRINIVAPWIELTIIVGLLSFLPKYRSILLSLAAAYWLVFQQGWIQWNFINDVASQELKRLDWVLNAWTWGLLAVIFIGFAIFFRRVRGKGTSFLARRPVLCLVCFFLTILVFAEMFPLWGRVRLLVWIFVALLAPYLWYFAYALKDASSKTSDDLSLQAGAFHPFYMATFQSFTPFGKGRSYLRKMEARTANELSVVQLKAVKLLLWIAVLKYFELLLIAIVHGTPWHPLQTLFHWIGFNVPNLGIPTFEAAVQSTVDGARISAHLAWASLIAHFMETLLTLYVSGNLVVACCRMAGFNILRNTYRPLESQTIAEFWNRYYFYFKELLVEFFFFPMYMRYFKKHPRLRKFAATLAAATLGNMLYHFCRDFFYVEEMGLSAAVSGYQVYAFYALLLGVGIGISQLRSREPIPIRGVAWSRRLLSSAIVITFFCLLEVFDYEPRGHTLAAHLNFFFNLFRFHV